VRFWDSSGLVPLVAEEAATGAMEGILAEDPEIVAWWATPVECGSAIARRARMGKAVPSDTARSAERLGDLVGTWFEVPPGERLRDLAVRLVRVHDLRAADALQLAAAIVASENRPETLDLVTLDERLADAARREGFRILGLP
jgi:uncharacterized protein